MPRRILSPLSVSSSEGISPPSTPFMSPAASPAISAQMPTNILTRSDTMDSFIDPDEDSMLPSDETSAYAPPTCTLLSVPPTATVHHSFQPANSAEGIDDVADAISRIADNMTDTSPGRRSVSIASLHRFVNGSLSHLEDIDQSKQDGIVDGFKEGISLLPHQVAGRLWMANQEKSSETRGGILADGMGLGKTIQVLSRIVDDRVRESIIGQEANPRFNSTLIICPLSVLAQWISEIKSKTENLRVVQHYGVKRSTDPLAFRNADIVVTTYDVARSEHAAFSQGASRCALYKVHWRRIVLDEAHTIKRRASKAAEACFALKGVFRWCLSGTPLQNDVQELFSLFKFLQVTPMDDWKTFRKQVVNPLKNGDTRDSMDRLHILLRAIMLRRGKEILTLPERRVHVTNCVFTGAELASYEDLVERYKRWVRDSGMSFGRTFTTLVRLKQACSLGPCEELRPEKSRLAVVDAALFDSPKLRMAIEILLKIRQKPGNQKTIIFSEFLSVLSVLGGRLKHLGLGFVIYNGDMDAAMRQEALNRINNDDSVTSILISLKCGSVGLNLTACNHVIMMDSWWNPAIEDQAFDRAHRVGQTRDVLIYKLILQGTIDEKLINMQERKRRVADDALGADSTDTHGCGGTGLSMEEIRGLFGII